MTRPSESLGYEGTVNGNLQVRECGRISRIDGM